MNTTPTDPRTPGPVQPDQPAATPPQYAAPVTPPPPAAPPTPTVPAHWQAQQPVQPQPPVLPQSPVQAQPLQQPAQPQFPAPPAYPVAPQAQYPQGFPPPASAQPTPGTPYAQPFGQPGQQFGQQPGYTAPGYGQQPPVPNYGQTPGYPSQQGQQGYPGYAMMAPPGPGEPFDGAANPDDLTRPLYGATIGQALSRFFKNYASFSGRASRSEYWWVALVFGGAWFVFSFLINILDAMAYSGPYGEPSMFAAFGGLILLIVSLGILVPSLALMWQRLHDANFAGPFFFLSFIPFFGGIIMIILAALPPKVEGRRFFRGM